MKKIIFSIALFAATFFSSILLFDYIDSKKKKEEPKRIYVEPKPDSSLRFTTENVKESVVDTLDMGGLTH